MSCPSSPAISVGGGSTAFRVRTAVDVWAASLRRGTGPSASRPPASQTTRSACAAPVRLPASRSAAPRKPVPSDRAAVRPIADPTDSPIPTVIRRPARTTYGRMPMGTASSGSTRCGSARTATAPPASAPSRPPTCGSAPDWNPRMTARTTSRIATRSNGFTARSSHRGQERAANAAGGGVAASVRQEPRRLS